MIIMNTADMLIIVIVSTIFIGYIWLYMKGRTTLEEDKDEPKRDNDRDKGNPV